MIASHTAVSSSLTSLPAFETEHTLYLAEQNLQRPHTVNKDNNSDDRNDTRSFFAHSAALQLLADAYVDRRAGDRGDNLVRAAALLARAASFPANSDDEKHARAAALSRLGRALLARSQLDLRFIHNIDIGVNDNIDPSEADTEEKVDPEADAHKKQSSAKDANKKEFPDVPAFLQLARNPNPNVSRVAQKSLLATTAAAEAVASSTPNFEKLKAAFEHAEATAAASVDGLKSISESAPPTEGPVALADLGAEFTVLRNTLAALHVDRARALIFGGASPGTPKDGTVAKRVKEGMNALKLASKLRVPTSRRQKAAGALADIMLATLYSRTRGKAADGMDDLEEADRVRAARLFRSASATLVSVFGGGDGSGHASGSNTSASDADTTPSATPPTSPMHRAGNGNVEGSDCTEDGSPHKANGANGNSNTNNMKQKIPAQDPFEPFVDWDLDEVRKFVDAESQRLGPVMQEGEGRRSCTLF